MKTTKPFLKLSINKRGRDLIVGDVHGQGPLLDRLLQHAQFDPKRDRVIALGDLVDRGPDSAALIHRTTQKGWYSLMGNHEALMITAAEDWDVDRIWRRNGSDWAFASKPEALAQLRSIAARFPLAIELPLPDGRKIGLVHAEVMVGSAWKDLQAAHYDHRDATDDQGYTLAASALWGRKRIVADARMRTDPLLKSVSADLQLSSWEAAQPVPGIDLIISGHTVVIPPIPRGRSNVLWIETGAYEDKGRLTAVDPLSGNYWQVGHGLGEVYGPTPLPEIDPLPESWRPTPEIEARAECQREETRKKLALLGWGPPS